MYRRNAISARDAYKNIRFLSSCSAVMRSAAENTITGTVMHSTNAHRLTRRHFAVKNSWNIMIHDTPLWIRNIHRASKNMSPYICPYLCQMLNDFKNSFTGTLSGKFPIKWLLIIPPHLNCVATLPCETLMKAKLTIGAVSSGARRLFGHFRKFSQRLQQMIRTTVDCDLSLWIPDLLNDVFVADLPGLIPVY